MTSDWNALLQARLEATAKETADREWRATMQAVKDRDLPLIKGVQLRHVPDFETDVLPKFRRWAVVADLHSFGEWARKDLLNWE